MNKLSQDRIPLIEVSNELSISYKAETIAHNYFNANPKQDNKELRKMFVEAFKKGYKMCKCDLSKFLME